MTLAIFIVTAALLALVVILRLTFKRSLQIRAGANALAGQLRPIDVQAFRNLVNPMERDFLRQHLSGSQFRTVQRARLWAMAAYLQEAGRNAALLVRIGELALSTADPRTENAARELVDEALLVRRNTALALFRIYLALAWPHGTFADEGMLNSYERLSGAAMLLGRLQNPASAVRLSAH
jgi:hypothetical protein